MKVLGQCVETMPYLVVLELCPFVSSSALFLLSPGSRFGLVCSVTEMESVAMWFG